VKGTKTIFLWGKIAGALLTLFTLTAVLLGLPQKLFSDTGDKMWLKQCSEAFARGDLFVASQGCFADRIEVAWVEPVQSDTWKSAYKLELIWGVTPAPFYHRDGVVQFGRDQYHFAVTPASWKADKNFPNSPGRQQNPELLRNKMVYFQMGFYWGDTNARPADYRLFEGSNWPTAKYISGWMGKPHTSD